MLAQRLGHFDLGVFEKAYELQRVYDSFALIVIVRYDEGVLGVFVDVADARSPRGEFLGRVEIVVAFMGGSVGVVVEPRVIAATVEADIADG